VREGVLVPQGVGLWQGEALCERVPQGVGVPLGHRVGERDWDTPPDTEYVGLEVALVLWEMVPDSVAERHSVTEGVSDGVEEGVEDPQEEREGVPDPQALAVTLCEEHTVAVRDWVTLPDTVSEPVVVAD